MQYEANTPLEYLEQLPDDRKGPVSTLRKTILDNLPEGFEEGLNYKMLGYFVPLTAYPDGYHCNPKLPVPFVNVASQKNFVALYHMGLYAKKELLDWFVAEYPKHSKYKLDMGKSCIRFKKVEAIPYELIAELIGKMSMEEWLSIYEANIKK